MARIGRRPAPFAPRRDESRAAPLPPVLPAAVALLKELPQPKFDQTVELSFRLGVDPKQTDQTVRGALPLPKGTGKSVKVCVITDNADLQKAASEAGADFVGFEDIIEKDVAVETGH